MCTGLTLTQLLPRRPAAYRESTPLTTMPSWPAASASRETRSAVAGSAVTSPGIRYAPTTFSRIGSRSLSGRSMRSSPSTWRMSKNHGLSTVLRCASAPNRDIVSWKGRGPPSSSSESVSPSRMSCVAGKVLTTSTTSGTRWVISARLRV